MTKLTMHLYQKCQQSAKSSHHKPYLHSDVVEALRRIVRRAGSSALFSERRRDLMNRVLVVSQGAPMGSVDDEDREGKC